MKKTKNYYDEEKLQILLKQYQESTIVEEKVVIKKDEILENEITLEVLKIVKAIISVYRYYIFESYDDLIQHGIHACYTNFMKYNPEKGSSFNYFSLIARISLLNYTTRKAKHRGLHDIADQLDLETRKEINYHEFFVNLEDTLFKIVNENFIGSKRKEYIKIASIIIAYLKLNKKLVSKSDLYLFSRSKGIKNTQVRAFVKEISINHNIDLFTGVI